MADVRMLAEEPDLRHVLRRAWPHLRAHKGAVAAGVAVNLVSTLALTLIPVLIGRAVDRLLDHDRHGLLVTAGTVLGLVVARTILLRWSEVLLTRAGERVVQGLRDLVVRRLGETPLRFLEAHRGGDLLRRATVEIAELATFVRSQLPDLISLGGYLVFTAIVLISSSWELSGVLLLVFGPPMWWITRRFRRAAEDAYPAEAAAQATLSATFTESLQAREQLQIDGATGTWLARMRADAGGYLTTARAAQRAATWIDVTWVVQGLTSAALLVVGGLLAGADVVTVGVVVTFVLASRDLFSSVDDFTLVAGEMLESRVGLARLLDLLDAAEPPARTEVRERAETKTNRGLVADGVSYAYRDGEPVLHDVSVTFAPGEHAGLVGETGSGKTTLAKLLCGLYRPDGGSVRHDGAELAALDPAELRRRLVLIPQQVHVISGTLADNLALTPGRPGRADFAAAADRLGLTGWVEGLPGGFDAPLGRRGERFSAGERQLVGLVRAAMIDPDVLILDEATADLDPRTAHRIEAALATLRRDRTVLVIAHRTSTIERLPRIVRLHSGRVVEPTPAGRVAADVAFVAQREEPCP
ncbi:ABC transporter ATP-binding protein [Dactylosporangium sp. CS-033363]|uniref:ABC transporter ATP-binding protein n=1 Tax=Dactylosporangium sp. CS-033363 TaxID=3239935 RepID=UPI003D8F482A